MWPQSGSFGADVVVVVLGRSGQNEAWGGAKVEWRTGNVSITRQTQPGTRHGYLTNLQQETHERPLCVFSYTKLINLTTTGAQEGQGRAGRVGTGRDRVGRDGTGWAANMCFAHWQAQWWRKWTCWVGWTLTNHQRKKEYHKYKYYYCWCFTETIRLK